MPPKSKMPSLQDIERRIVTLLSDHISLKGVSVKSARIYALMYVQQELTQRELQKLTGYSAGTVSSSLAVLERYGAVKKQREKATREFRYSLSGSLAEIGKSMLSRSIESFNRRIEFFKHIDQRLDDPALVGKVGYDRIHSFVEEIRTVLPVYESVGRELVSIMSSSEDLGDDTL